MLLIASILIIGITLANSLADLLVVVYLTNVRPSIYGVLLSLFRIKKLPVPRNYGIANAYFSVLFSWVLVVVLLVVLGVVMGSKKDKVFLEQEQKP